MGGGLSPYMRQHGQHQRLAWIGHMQVSVLLDGAATEGQLTVVESRAERGDASPVHVHTQDDETFLLLDGAMTIWVGDHRVHLEPGGIAFLPRQLPHAFRFDTTSRALLLATPAGQEDFYRRAGWDLAQPRPDGWAVNPAVLKAAAADRGTTIIGPPHGLDD
jgi:quercetin dioxygenase-like cupin family protein